MSGLHTPTLDPSVIAPAVDVIHNGVQWASTCTPNVWDPAILTLDGGGIRGYSALLLLKALMHEIAVWERRFEKEEEKWRRRSSVRGKSGDAGAQNGLLEVPRGLGLGEALPEVVQDEALVVPLTESGDIIVASTAADSIPGRTTVANDTDIGAAREDAKTGLFPLPPGSSDSGTGGTTPTGHVRANSGHSFLGIPNGGPAEALEPPDPDEVADDDSNNPEGLSEFEDSLLPCHYFDFMYGTSTGGLIATMLGRLRMSVPQCLKIYREVSEGLFGRRRSSLPLRTKYHHHPLETVVQTVVKEHCKQHANSCLGDDWHPWDAAYGSDSSTSSDSPDVKDSSTSGADFNNNICQSICLTAVHNGKIDVAHLLRTYDLHYVNIPNWTTPYNEGADRMRIWEVTRATSAAPFYFKALQAELEGEVWSFKDGGIRENNPAGAAFSEFVSMYGESKDPALLLSIGTGRPNEERDGFAAAWPGPLGNSRLLKKWAEKFAVLKNVLVKYTAGEETHKKILNTARGEHTWYKRLNVSQGLEALPLDHWKRGLWTDPATGIEKEVPGGATLTLIEECTKDYLKRGLNPKFDTYAEPAVMLSQVAEKLVRQRRAREELARSGSDKDRMRWDTFVGRYLTGRYMPDADTPISMRQRVS